MVITIESVAVKATPTNIITPRAEMRERDPLEVDYFRQLVSLLAKGREMTEDDLLLFAPKARDWALQEDIVGRENTAAINPLLIYPLIAECGKFSDTPSPWQEKKLISSASLALIMILSGKQVTPELVKKAKAPFVRESRFARKIYRHLHDSYKTINVHDSTNPLRADSLRPNNPYWKRRNESARRALEIINQLR